MGRPRKYATEEERLEARRARSREYARKKRAELLGDPNYEPKGRGRPKVYKNAEEKSESLRENSRRYRQSEKGKETVARINKERYELYKLAKKMIEDENE